MLWGRDKRKHVRVNAGLRLTLDPPVTQSPFVVQPETRDKVRPEIRPSAADAKVLRESLRAGDDLIVNLGAGGFRFVLAETDLKRGDSTVIGLSWDFPGELYCLPGEILRLEPLERDWVAVAGRFTYDHKWIEQALNSFVKRVEKSHPVSF